MKVRYLTRGHRIFDISNGSADAHLEKTKNKKPQLDFGFLFASEFLNPDAPCYVFVYGYVFIYASCYVFEILDLFSSKNGKMPFLVSESSEIS